jgi:glycogen operon protein
MLLAGDELLRTQRGNNNAWCQDNEVGWLDWRLVERNAAMLRFVRALIELRKRHPSLMRRTFLAENGGARGAPDIAWHGTALLRRCGVTPRPELAFTLAATAPDEAELRVAQHPRAITRRCRAAERHWFSPSTPGALLDDVIGRTAAARGGARARARVHGPRLEGRA